MKNQPKNNSSLPLIIIVLVLVAGVGGAYWLYNSSPSSTSNSNRAATANTSRTPQSAVAAPLGAQPPNMLGSATAAVTVEEFADFQCGACASVHPVMKELQSIYGSRMRFIFRNFPLNIPAHNKAYDAAVAVEAAGLQDRSKFWAMQDLLFRNQQEWTDNPNYRDIWAGYAEKIGLDVNRFQDDIATAASAKERVNLDLARGRALNVDSTPTVLVNGRPVPLSGVNIASLRQIIDAEIQTAETRAPTSTPGSAGVPANAANAPANTK